MSYLGTMTKELTHFTAGKIMIGLLLVKSRMIVRFQALAATHIFKITPVFIFLLGFFWLLSAPVEGLAVTGHAFPVFSGSSERFDTRGEGAGLGPARELAGNTSLALNAKAPLGPSGKFQSGTLQAGKFQTSKLQVDPELLKTQPAVSKNPALREALSASVEAALVNNFTLWVKGRYNNLIAGPESSGGVLDEGMLELNLKDPRLWEPLISKLVADGFNEARVRKAFDELGPRYTSQPMGRKVLELYGLRYGGGLQPGSVEGEEEMIVESDFAPVPTSLSLAGCRKLIKNNDKLFKGVQKRYGVPANTIVALLLVETNLGNDLGSDPAFRNLASMALSTTPEYIAQHLQKIKLNKEKRDFIQTSLDNKSAWAYGELKALINYADSMGFELMKIPGSIYGAIGICQFMPSNIEPYGIDGDGDGKVNLFKLVDAVHSVANYLRQHGWKPGMEPFQQVQVLRAYNQDNIYAYTVQAVSGRLALGDEFNKSPAVMATNPLNLVRGVVVPGYKKRGKVTNPLKPMQGYNDILGINPSPKKIKNGVIPGLPTGVN